MPDFEILFGGYWMKILAEDYVVPVNSYGTCSICLFGTDRNYWLLGDVFLRGWYSIHDHTNGQMGFVPYSGSAKTKPDAATSTPTAASPTSESGSSESACIDPNALNIYDYVMWALGGVILTLSAVAWCKIPRHNGKMNKKTADVIPQRIDEEIAVQPISSEDKTISVDWDNNFENYLSKT